VVLLKDYDSDSYDVGTYDEGEPPARRVVVNLEHPPSKLAVIVKAPDGTPIGRWAEDEAKVENVLGNLTKSGEMPGGHHELGCVLARDPKQSYPDLGLFSRIELQGAGGEVLWSGGLRQLPESDGDHIAIEPKAVGDKQLLEDDETVVGPGFINSDLSKWTGPSTTRRLNLNAANFPHQQDASVTPDAQDEAALHMEVQGSWASPVIPTCEAWFDGQGVDIGAVLGNWVNGSSDTKFLLSANFCDDDVGTDLEGTGDIYATATGLLATTASVPRPFAYLDWNYTTTPAGLDGQSFSVDLINLKVLSWIAQTTLALQGEWPNVGFLAKQMLPFIADLASLTTDPELLEDDGFIIPQAWFDAPGTPMSKLIEITKYGQLDWFIFNDGILQNRFPGTYGRRWRLQPGAGTPKNSGQDAGRVLDAITVSYQDVDGTTKTIGPAGSGATFLDDRLRIFDERNAAVAAGRPKRKLLALNGVCTAELALQVGIRFLEEAANLAQSGEVQISGYVQSESGAWYPSAYVQPGDYVADPGTTNYRKVTAPSYAHDSKTASCSIGAPPEGLGQIEARFNARLIELGFGS
jgi:hypothetical protein